MKFGDVIKARREALGFTAAQLAEIAGLATKTILAAEIGATRTAPETRRRLCEALRLDHVTSEALEVPKVSTSGFKPMKEFCIYLIAQAGTLDPRNRKRLWYLLMHGEHSEDYLEERQSALDRDVKHAGLEFAQTNRIPERVIRYAD